MQTKTLLTVDYHYDTDTGMVAIGEVDFGVHGELASYIKKYGYQGVKEILAILGHLAWEVKQEYFKSKKEQRKNSGSKQ